MSKKVVSRSKSKVLLFFVFLLTAILVGCVVPPAEQANPTSDSPTEETPTAKTQTEDSPSELVGSEWELLSIYGEPLIEDSYISLKIEQDLLTGYSGCNSYGSRSENGASIIGEEGELAFTEMEMTSQLCSSPEGVMDQENLYIQALSGAVAYNLENDRLEFQNASEKIALVYNRLEVVPLDPVVLPGTKWRLVSIDDMAFPRDVEVTLAFLDDKWLTGFAGCRNYVAVYQVKKDEFRLPYIAMLENDCPQGGSLLAEEGYYTTLLDSARSYRLHGEMLEIQSLQGNLLVYERLKRQDNAALEGPVWELVASITPNQVEGIDALLPMDTSVLSGTQITIRLDGETASGSAGCSSYQAAYVKDSSMLAFVGPPEVIDNQCELPVGIVEQESFFLDLLHQVNAYQEVGDLLWLEVEGEQALVFKVNTPGVIAYQFTDAIMAKANQAVIDRVGREFFEQNYTFDPASSIYDGSDPGCNPGDTGCEQRLAHGIYMMVYRFLAPGHPEFETLAGFTLKVREDKIKATDFMGIPDCVLDPNECNFPVDEQSARRIASEAGLEQGLDDWETSLHWWGSEPETYVWTISNTLSSDQNTGQSNGKSVVIDANSGEVMQILDWAMMP